MTGKSSDSVHLPDCHKPITDDGGGIGRYLWQIAELGVGQLLLNSHGSCRLNPS